MKNNKQIKKLCALAMFCALAYICLFVFRIKVSFLTFDAKDAVITIGAMFFGPLSGIIMSLVVAFLEAITVSDTQFWGFVMNFISSAVFASIAPLIYKYKRSISGAVIGLTCSVAAMTASMVILNLLITPIYTGASIDEVKRMILPLLLPFNLTKAVLNAALVLLLYKPITRAMYGAKLIQAKQQHIPSAHQNKKNTIIVLAISLALIAASLVVFLFVLNGSFK